MIYFKDFFAYKFLRSIYYYLKSTPYKIEIIYEKKISIFIFYFFRPIIYILEKIFEEEQDSNSIYIYNVLVVACTRLFFKRAPEMHGILAKLYQHVLKNSVDPDLRQTVTVYYRLLQQDVRLAEQMIN